MRHRIGRECDESESGGAIVTCGFCGAAYPATRARCPECNRTLAEQARETNGPAAYYGNLARVAIGFHVQTGNPAELHAAYWYTRHAVRHVAERSSDATQTQ